MRQRILIFLMGAVAALSLAVPASAGQRFQSKVTIHLPPDMSAGYFFGAVKSDKPACEGGRTISIFVDLDGDGDYGRYAHGLHSNGDGTWTFHADPYVTNGYYQAVAAVKHVKGGTCAKATSKRFFVD